MRRHKLGDRRQRLRASADWLCFIPFTEGGGGDGGQVSGDNSHKRVSGSNLGGGTFWGLCRLLTRVRTFEEMLELSKEGDNSKVTHLNVSTNSCRHVTKSQGGCWGRCFLGLQDTAGSADPAGCFLHAQP